MKAPALPKLKLPAFDFQAMQEEFKSLDPKDPGLWPLLPRIVTLVGLMVALLVSAWWFGWNPQLDELEAKRLQETKLKEEWLDKKKQAVNLDEYRKQLVEIDRSFGALLRQLPNKAEMGGLLVDINQAGVGRGLQFDLFKPGNEVTKDFYAELPITIKLLGNYHDLGGFTGDIAKLPRIVTLNDIDIVTGKDGGLVMTTVVKTFRYLDAEEMSQQKKAKAAQTKGVKK
ncbi:MAG: type 4a pilus biogenesis protein PilO [Betaproteobacteria bacterium]|nr:type 4a pilus biogenesis protein PilO [Betaproteobacteria bacterium]